jgi:hypothetical protein
MRNRLGQTRQHLQSPELDPLSTPGRVFVAQYSNGSLLSQGGGRGATPRLHTQSIQLLRSSSDTIAHSLPSHTARCCKVCLSTGNPSAQTLAAVAVRIQSMAGEEPNGMRVRRGLRLAFMQITTWGQHSGTSSTRDRPVLTTPNEGQIPHAWPTRDRATHHDRKRNIVPLSPEATRDTSFRNPPAGVAQNLNFQCPSLCWSWDPRPR